ncbi:hypothetical protein FSP39_014365 [Pinctada imbricata]|uniref:PHD-type domain-containing protein n=1 Tax=Pinctada imbricata TaxID=66713 RepID=A0AA89C4Y1_PINIB|nr:hypothetical protein FSP39_014365 [Pinctada imbricata]
MLTLLLSGDVSLNPGPVKNPCTKCQKAVRKNQQSIQCDRCDYWTHRVCIGISVDEYELLGKSDAEWVCEKCGSHQ